MAGTRLSRTLTTADTFSIATGGMFSSGFFLLPGIAAALTGTSAVLAYLVAGVLMVPAMLSKAEMATALPRSGGTYFFVDRALGPLVGVSAGFSTWLALVLKTAFALLGLAAYVALWFDVPVVPVAVASALVFTAVNVVSTSHSADLQRWLVGILLATLAAFLVAGGYAASGIQGTPLLDTALHTDAFLRNGWGGFAATVGMVSVSYAGLTKVASVAEEVKDPDTAIPNGMFWALGVTTTIYVVGVTVVLALLPSAALTESLAPVGEAAKVAFSGPWETVGTRVVVAAAHAAFVSTANAGLMAAARYPLAMARDGAMPARLGEVADNGSPRAAVLLTGGLVIAAVCFDVASVAKLASTVQLVLFGLVCASVIVLRESGIDGYVPGFRSPLYPWVQIVGMGVSGALIVAMGWVPFVFAVTLLVGSALAHRVLVGVHTERRGAIGHVFRRLGERACDDIEHEMAGIVAERALYANPRGRRMVARVQLGDGTRMDRTIDHRIVDGRLPAGVLVVLVERGQDAFVPGPTERLLRGDQLTLAGQPDRLELALGDRFTPDDEGDPVAATGAASPA
jgi:amino acid transporter